MIQPWEVLLDIGIVAALLLFVFLRQDRKRNRAKAWADETEHWRAHAKSYNSVQPVTKQDSGFPLAEWVTPILSGPYQNAVEVESGKELKKGYNEENK